MPTSNNLSRRIPDLLRDPREALDTEFKSWLDLVNNEEHKAILAKAIIALANHGGGVVVIGFEETPEGVVAADGRPENLSAYSPDRVNSVVSRYVEPPFHCDVQTITSPLDGHDYPVVVAPGGHRTPIRSRRDGPNGNVIRQNTYYTRRPGPQSEPPQSGQEWDTLIRHCISNARDELLDHFRLLMTGALPAASPPDTELERVSRWFDSSIEYWQRRANALPAGHHAKLQHGHYAVGYQLFADELEPRRGAALLEAMRVGTVRYTGWPPFWVPTRPGIAPYMLDDNVECWLGPDDQNRDSAHSDFWRASPEAQFFLLRGHQEDGLENDITPSGQIFDLTLPTWRIGEVLLHAASMARQFNVPRARVVMVIEWTGLAGRRITNLANRNRLLFDGHTSRQATYRTNISAQADQIADTLPELVDRLVRPLYELFDFFQLPATLVTEELARMRERRF